MQRHKIVARIILLILSVISFALAAPLLERGIREVPIDEGDVAKDDPLTTGSQRRWNPSSDSVHWSEQDLRLHDPRSPMDPSAPGSGLPVDLAAPPPEHDGLQFDMDLDDHSPPQPGQEVADGPDSGSHSTGSVTHINSYNPADFPQPSLEAIDGPDSGSHLTDSVTQSSSYHPADFPQPSLETIGGPDSGPPLTGSLTHSSSYRPTDFPQPSLEAIDGPDSGPHLTNLPQPSNEEAGGPDSEHHSTDSQTDSSSYHSTDHPWPLLYNEDPEVWGDWGPPMQPSTYDHPILWLHHIMPHVDGNGDDFYHNPYGLPSPTSLSEQPPAWPYSPVRVPDAPASYPGNLRLQSDPGEPTGTVSLSDLEHSTGEHSPPDLGLSTSPVSESEQLQHDLQNTMSDLLRGGRLKRRISRPRSVNAAQRELQDSFDSRQYVSAQHSPSNSP